MPLRRSILIFSLTVYPVFTEVTIADHSVVLDDAELTRYAVYSGGQSPRLERLLPRCLAAYMRRPRTAIHRPNYPAREQGNQQAQRHRGPRLARRGESRRDMAGCLFV